MEADSLVFKGKDLLIQGDCVKAMRCMQSKFVDVVFADPPYFLSNGGISYNSGKIVCVDKGDWDKSTDEQSKIRFTVSWIKECKRVLKDDGTIWITGTFHNIFEVGTILKNEGFKILNVITWVKTDPPPNVSKRMFTHSSEFIIWAKKSPKGNQTYNYDEMYKQENVEMTDVWHIPAVPKNEKLYGYHPTQKPFRLLERIILASSAPSQVVLDPFAGSCTTAIAALKHKRKYVCIENEAKYHEIGFKRIKGCMS